MRVLLKLVIFLICFFLFQNKALSKLGNTVSENQRQYGRELETKQFSETDRNFSGKKIYQLPYFGWQLEAIYKNGKSFSETARPKGNKVKTNMIKEREANTIADFLYPKGKRGSYKKYVKNANFLSHFFEYGVVSFEMQLDKRKKNHLGVIGVRTVLYSDGNTFKSIKINAYH